MLIAAMIWGLAFVAQEMAAEIPAFTMGVARNVVAAIVLIPIIIVFDKARGTGRLLVSRSGIDINRTELVGGIFCGIILAAGSALQQLGINMGTESGKAGFITALYVVLVPIYALFIGKRAPVNAWFGVGLAAVGFYLLCITEELTIASCDLFVILCSLVFPLHILVIDHYSPRCDGIRMSFIQFVTAAVVSVILALIFEGPIALEPILRHILPVLYLGVGSSGIAYTLQIIGQRGANPSAAAVILSLESVFAVIGSTLIQNHVMSPREYWGSAIVFIAVLLAQLDLTPLIKKLFQKSKAEITKTTNE